MLKHLWPLLAAVLIAGIVSCGGPPREEGPVRILAAASLSDVLTDVVESYRKSNPEIVVECSFGGSGELATQILAGAPADIFISADGNQMDRVEHAGRVIPETRRDLIGNHLVIALPKGATAELSGATGLLELGRIAIGGPSVPAGEYARQWLSARGLLSPLEARLVPLENVRAVIAAVETGQVDAGFVYRTDLEAAPGAVLGYEIPDAEQPKIFYSWAIIEDTPRRIMSGTFVDWLETPWAMIAWRKHGFILPGIQGVREG